MIIMANYFILIKRKTAESWKGAIPAKSGVTKQKIRSTMKTQLKKGYTYKIVTKTQLRNLFSKIINKKKK